MKNGTTLLTRTDFREGVFERDNHKCVMCGADAVDAHHIIERRLFDDGGYYLNNGSSLCGDCHMAAEKTDITVEQIRAAIGIETPILPPDFYRDVVYDKWGNVFINKWTRAKGPLFFDESVQKVIADHLDEFSDLVKYPRTWHFPWSSGTKDDRILKTTTHFHGKQVVVTEKMDGECFPSFTKICMADGSYIPIGTLVNDRKIGLCVKGIDENGDVVDSKITRVYNNGNIDGEWINIRFRVPVRGSNRSLYVTSDHKFILPDKTEKPSSELKVGDRVIWLMKQHGLSNIQFQVLLGKLLGDGSINEVSGKWYIQYAHVKSHKEYVSWTNQYLGNVSTHATIDGVSGYGSDMVKSWTVCSMTIKNAFSFLYSNGLKIIPPEIVDVIDPIAIAFWYMDDGTLVHHNSQRDRMQFSVCGFDIHSCDNLVLVLNKFGVDGKVKQFGGYFYININADNTKKLAKLISPYICSCMRYKLPLEFRDVVPIEIECGESESEYTPVEVVITDISTKTIPYRGKYDIETETHNYFANGILVHNCTSIYKNYAHARSLAPVNGSDHSWVKVTQSMICSDLPDGWRVCGENVYRKHSIQYHDLASYFLAFSIWDDRNVCLSWDATEEWLELFGLTSVPVLYRGIWDEALIKKMWSESEYDIQEGYVVRVEDSFTFNEFRKSIAKFVRPNHVQSSHHWKREIPVINTIKQGS